MHIRNRRFPPGVIPQRIRFGEGDRIIWLRYCHQTSYKYIAFDYDLPVGEGVKVSSDGDEVFAEDYEHLTKHRIDAVGILPNEIHVIEVKRRGSSTAFGQALLYSCLYRRTFQPGKQVIPMIVCESALPMDVKCFDRFGVKCVIC